MYTILSSQGYKSQFSPSYDKSMVLYMSLVLSFWLMEVESHDFSHAEKERNAYKAKQIHKMTTIITQNGPRLSF